MSDETQAPEGTTRERQYAKPNRGQRRVLVGTVLPNKMQKTATVQIERTEMHPKYKKYIRKHSKVYAHDPKDEAQPGDLVRVIEARPTSKLKRFALVEIIKKAGT
jgi:small subunit ribosomal protein S17